MRHILLTFIICLLAGACPAQTWKERSCSLRVYYPLDKAEIDLNYRDNRRTLDSLAAVLQRLSADVPHRRLVLHITSYASLEASYTYNEKLTGRRTASLLRYLKEHLPVCPDSIAVSSRVFDWNTLSDRVRSEEMPHRREVMEVLLSVDGEEGNRAESLRKSELQSLGGGTLYRFINRHFGADMRQSTLGLTWQALDAESLRPSGLAVPSLPAIRPLTVAAPAEQPRARRPFYMAVKTNLLYDALLVPNLGVEFALGKQWSVAGNWMYAWWKSDRKHDYWRVYGGDLELRRWFGRKAEQKPLTGHHVGLYGGIVTYDFERGGRGYLGDRWSYFAGISYGYSHPIARRLNLDFTIGVGYLGGEYKEYLPIDGCYVWQSTKQRNWIGPTKAEVSLVWLWGRGNYNKKGGNR